MKKLLLSTAALVLVLAVAVPALAGSGTRLTAVPDAAATGNATSFVVNGEVVQVFATAGAVKVHVRLGNVGVRPFIGRDLTMRIGRNAVLLSIDDGIARALTLRQLREGQNVQVEGRIDRSAPLAPVYVATRVHVRHWTPTAALTEFACGGTVSAVETGGVRLVVNAASRALWSAIGTEVAIAVPEGARLFTWVDGLKVPIALGDVGTGDRVWIRGTIDRGSGAPAYSADVLVLRAAAAQP
jgi:hypothetical protein